VFIKSLLVLIRVLENKVFSGLPGIPGKEKIMRVIKINNCKECPYCVFSKINDMCKLSNYKQIRSQKIGIPEWCLLEKKKGKGES